MASLLLLLTALSLSLFFELFFTTELKGTVHIKAIILITYNVIFDITPVFSVRFPCNIFSPPAPENSIAGLLRDLTIGVANTRTHTIKIFFLHSSMLLPNIIVNNRANKINPPGRSFITSTILL